jgi:chromosome segregation ATPase
VYQSKFRAFIGIINVEREHTFHFPAKECSMGKKAQAALRMAEATEKLAEIFAEMSRRDRHVDELQRELTKSRNEVYDLKKRLQDAGSEIETLRAETAHLAWLVEALKRDLRESSGSSEPEEPGLMPPGDELVIVP